MAAATRPAGVWEASTSHSDAEHLAKQLSNPIANLVSIPLQFNWEQGAVRTWDCVLKIQWCRVSQLTGRRLDTPQHMTAAVGGGVK